jgi:hypothetical protein
MPRFRKADFVRQAGLLFQPRLGGSPSPITGWLIKRHGFGTHFGNLTYTDAEGVLRSLLDRGIPIIVELDVNRIGPFAIYGLHSVVLVGYSDPFEDANGQCHEDYYVVDSAWPRTGPFSLEMNDWDVDGDGLKEAFPGNRTWTRAAFRERFAMQIYFPVFPTQAEHDAWYRANMRVRRRFPLIGWLYAALVSGSYDEWISAAEPTNELDE